jgi:hypothetical protein
MCEVKGRTVEIKTPTHWNLIGRSITAHPPSRLRHRPAVFFRHIRPFALSSPPPPTQQFGTWFISAVIPALEFLGEFVKLRKATISFLSVRPAPAGRIFINLDI